MDLFEKIATFTRVKEAQTAGLYPFFLPFQNSEGTTAKIDGKEVIMLGSNNYLGLTTHPRVRQAAMEAIRLYGTSCTGSRFLNGTLELHLELERRLAAYMGCETALTFPSGYQTNVGAITALIGKGDYVILDKEDHASLVDGALMSFGTMRRFSHNDLQSLENILQQIPGHAGKLVIVDGVYSMGGDIAPLPEIVAICKRFGARIMVDDVHGIGVLGNGHGTVAHFGLENDVDIIMGAFSKSFASVGGFLAGKVAVLDYIRHHARSLIFSASLPPANAATVLACLDILESDSSCIEDLWDNIDYMRMNLKRIGYNIGPSNSPIIPLIIGDELRTALAWRALLENGVYVNPVVPPGVPEQKSLLRTSYTATHQRVHLDKALAAFEAVGKRFDLLLAQ